MTTRIHSRLNIIIFLVLIFIVNQALAFADSIDEKENIVLNWAFGALVGPDNNRKLISITKDTTLKAGDQLKILINKKSEYFVYLIYYGSNGELVKLFPNNSNNVNEKYFIPQGDLWFALDEHKGKETFHLIASKKRLDALEELLNKYQLSAIEDKSTIRSQIIKEIKKVQRIHEKFTVKAERPIQIAGSVRGSKDKDLSYLDITNLLVEITATNFFSRTFTVEHE